MLVYATQVHLVLEGIGIIIILHKICLHCAKYHYDIRSHGQDVLTMGRTLSGSIIQMS